MASRRSHVPFKQQTGYPLHPPKPRLQPLDQLGPWHSLALALRLVLADLLLDPHAPRREFVLADNDGEGDPVLVDRVKLGGQLRLDLVRELRLCPPGAVSVDEVEREKRGKNAP